LLGSSTAAEIEVKGSESDCHTVMLVPSMKPSEYATKKETDEADTPEPNQSQNCGGLDIILNYSEGL